MVTQPPCSIARTGRPASSSKRCLQDLGRAIAPPHDPAVRIRLRPLVEECPSSILLDDVVRLTDCDSIALLEQEDTIAEALHGSRDRG